MEINIETECEKSVIHDLDFNKIVAEIYEDFALFFLKKHIGKELNFFECFGKSSFCCLCC